MTNRDLATNKLVLYAEQMGFMAFGANAAARRHFHWFMDDSYINGEHSFSVHLFKNCETFLTYTIDRQTTSCEEMAMKWLKQAIGGVKDNGKHQVFTL